jgi:predicted Zn-ribbon and HTH transcriptional regulator
MTDARCKEIMTQFGMPESRSLMQALFQVANETEQEVRNKLTIESVKDDTCEKCKYYDEASDMYPCSECCYCKDSYFVHR